MAVAITFGTIFATQPSTTEMSYLDGNYNQISAALANAPTFSNYAADSGAVNAIVVTLAGITGAYTDGTRFQFKCANTTTATNPTLAVNGGAADVITNADGTVLQVGALVAGVIYEVFYNSTTSKWVLAQYLRAPGMAFSAYSAAQTTGNPFVGSTISKSTGVSGGFNTATGVFTAPLTGWYHFAIQTSLQNLSGSTANLSMTFETSNIGTVVSDWVTANVPNGQAAGLINDVITFMNAGDTTSLVASPAISATNHLNSNSTFCCYYLGPN